MRFLALALALISGPVWAACTGSGLAWNCTAGSSISQINSAISGSADGATITVANGSYSWSGNLSFSTTKATTIKCATVGGCTVSMSGPLWHWTNFGTSTKLKRISGFVFNNVGQYFIWLYGVNSNPAVLTQLRIDNNTFNVNSSTTDVIALGEVSGANNTFYGVIDNNVFRTNTGNSRYLVMYYQRTGTWPASRLGTAENLFIENNRFIDQCNVDIGRAALDTDGGPHTWVVRYNSFTNARIEHHGYYWSFPGPASSEVYGNTFSWTCGNTSGNDSIKHQGSGEWIVFDNTVTTSGGKGSGHKLQNYRSFYDGEPNKCDATRAEDGNRSPTTTYRGYPCNRQPGRNAAAELSPHYYWNNRWGDNTALVMGLSCPGTTNYCPSHIQANRDYYQGGVVPQTSPSSPFSGTSGIGFGTLANRPAACTPTPEPLDAGYGGVGYFATDTNTLYRCSTANTWAVHYKPFTYPHPLTASSSPTPNPPTDVGAT